MRQLIYIIENLNKEHFTDEYTNYYHFNLLDYVSNAGIKMEKFVNFYSSYNSKTNWFLSLLNGTENPFINGNNFLKRIQLKDIKYKNNLILNTAALRGIKVRCTEINSTNNLSNISESGDLSGRLGEVLGIEEILNDMTPNVIDFIYDTSVTDELNSIRGDKLTSTDITNASNNSRLLFNEELFRKYDEVFIITYCNDYDIDNQPVLFKIINHPCNDPVLKYTERVELFTQSSFYELLFNKVINKDYIILNDYDKTHNCPNNFILIVNNEEDEYVFITNREIPIIIHNGVSLNEEDSEKYWNLFYSNPLIQMMY